LEISIMDIIMDYTLPRYVGVVISILLILLLSTLILFFKKQIAQYHYTRKSSSLDSGAMESWLVSFTKVMCGIFIQLI